MRVVGIARWACISGLRRNGLRRPWRKSRDGAALRRPARTDLSDCDVTALAQQRAEADRQDAQAALPRLRSARHGAGPRLRSGQASSRSVRRAPIVPVGRVTPGEQVGWPAKRRAPFLCRPASAGAACRSHRHGCAGGPRRYADDPRAGHRGCARSRSDRDAATVPGPLPAPPG